MQLWIVLGLVVSAISGCDARRELDQTLLQQDTAAPKTSTNDEVVVTTAFGTTPVNMENLKAYIRARSLNDVGLYEDLVTRTACIVRLQQDIGGEVTTIALQDYLINRDLSTAGSKDELFDRSCNYKNKELEVEALFGTTIGSITVEQLKTKLSTFGFISTVGGKPQLVQRLGQVSRDIATIKKLLNDNTFDPVNVKSVLSARGLSTEGQADKLLTRLADYLVTAAQNTVIPGVSSHCDLVVESGICLHGGEKIFTRHATPRGLVGLWTFDDAYMLDQSGHANHAKEPITFGPGRNSRGQSASFDGQTMLEIPHSTDFEGPNFCVTYWVYLLSDSTGQWRTLVHKGARDNERTPTFFLEPQTRGVEFFVSTTDDSQPAGERVWSNTFIPLRRWTHVTGCAEGRNLRLFINGILDAENTTVGTPIINRGSFYVGNDPWRPAGGISGYVDDLRYYSRVLSVDEIQAEAATALGLVEPSFVELGCMGCSLDNCAKACRHGFQMCSQRDLYSGGYFVARSMSWASQDTRIWSAEDGKTDAAGSKTASGLCMCCRIAQD